MKIKLAEHNLNKEYNAMKEKERDLQKREQELMKQSQLYKDRTAELEERERLVNEILRLHDFPIVKNGDLKNYINGSHNASTAFDSHQKHYKDDKFSLSPQYIQKTVPQTIEKLGHRQPHTQ